MIKIVCYILIDNILVCLECANVRFLKCYCFVSKYNKSLVNKAIMYSNSIMLIFCYSVCVLQKISDEFLVELSITITFRV